MKLIAKLIAVVFCASILTALLASGPNRAYADSYNKINGVKGENSSKMIAKTEMGHPKQSLNLKKGKRGGKGKKGGKKGGRKGKKKRTPNGNYSAWNRVTNQKP